MAVSHVEIHTENLHDQNLRNMRRNPIPVTISRNLPYSDTRILLLKHLTIVIMVSQMDDTVRLNAIHTVSHKTEGAVRIGQNQYFHLQSSSAA
jgi:hypothetical protein